MFGEQAAEAHFYHVMSRAIEGRMIFDDVAKERFRALLDAQLALYPLFLRMSEPHEILRDGPKPNARDIAENFNRLRRRAGPEEGRGRDVNRHRGMLHRESRGGSGPGCGGDGRRKAIVGKRVTFE